MNYSFTILTYYLSVGKKAFSLVLLFVLTYEQKDKEKLENMK